MSFVDCALFLLLGFASLVHSQNRINATKQSLLKKDATEEAVQVSFSNDSVVSELQHTICSVKTEEIVAKAQSTSSRVLTGVCTSEELTKAFKSMEKTFAERLEQVQRNLTNFIQSKFQCLLQTKNSKNSKSSPFRTIDYYFDKNILNKYT